MLFRRTYQKVIIFYPKTNFTNTNSSSRFFSLRGPIQTNKKYSRYSNAVLASVALGLSAYIYCKQFTLCETAVMENEERNSQHWDEAIRKSRDLLQRIKDEVGAPGIVVGVSVNGRAVWTEGLGYADIENRVLCSADTVMRIASISKSITMAAVAKLWEQGKLDLDKPVQDYVPYFPSKTFDGKPVTITCRQLVSHLGGIRHYDKSPGSPRSKKEEIKVINGKLKKTEISEFEQKEYLIKDHYADVKSSLDIFKDDPLIANPGSKHYYSTHGWTLISAIIEAASKEQFSTLMTKLFKSLGMSTTYLDVNDVLIYHRSRNYMKNKNGHLMNAPYVDNSYKWAGGGFLSTVKDLLQFGNAMLYSLQFNPSLQTKSIQNELFEKEKNIISVDENISNNLSDKELNVVSSKPPLPGYLNSKTVETMWTPITDTKDGKYGMGWAVFPEVEECLFCETKKFSVYHTGGAVGASSVLLILPQKFNNEMKELDHNIPKGIVVVILTNLQSVGLSKTALKIAQFFDNQSVSD